MTFFWELGIALGLAIIAAMAVEWFRREKKADDADDEVEIAFSYRRGKSRNREER